MRYLYYTVDVFTETRFGGNPLAVLPNAKGLTDAQMQQIAREFNFSETTFVFGSKAHTRAVRIFTPTIEVPFAGHPNVGTAFALASAGEFGEITGSLEITFEEKAGIVPIAIRKSAGQPIWCELKAPQAVSLGETVSAKSLAQALSLTPDDVVTQTHLPQVASVGLPFLSAELSDRAALERARPHTESLERLASRSVPPDVFVYTRSADEFDIRARMFAPLDGVPEDPATGSASCALAGLLASHDPSSDGSFRWRIAQGVEMGRPSMLDVRAEKKGGAVVATWVGGACVSVSEGTLEVD